MIPYYKFDNNTKDIFKKIKMCDKKWENFTKAFAFKQYFDWIFKTYNERYFDKIQIKCFINIKII